MQSLLQSNLALDKMKPKYGIESKVFNVDPEILLRNSLIYILH